MYKTAFCRRVNGDVLNVTHQKQQKRLEFLLFLMFGLRGESVVETVLLTFHFEEQKKEIFPKNHGYLLDPSHYQ